MKLWQATFVTTCYIVSCESRGFSKQNLVKEMKRNWWIIEQLDNLLRISLNGSKNSWNTIGFCVLNLERHKGKKGIIDCFAKKAKESE